MTMRECVFPPSPHPFSVHSHCLLKPTHRRDLGGSVGVLGVRLGKRIGRGWELALTHTPQHITLPIMNIPPSLFSAPTLFHQPTPHRCQTPFHSFFIPLSSHHLSSLPTSTPLSTASHEDRSHQGLLGWTGTTCTYLIL